MRKKRIIAYAAVVALLLFFGITAAQELDFMTKGGATLLTEVLKSCEGCDMKTIFNSKNSKEQWQEFLEGKGALAKLNEKEKATLAAYLAVNMPAPKVKATDPKKLKEKDLPLDGQAILLDNCTLCHPLGPIFPEERDVAAWEGVYYTLPHPDLELEEEQIQELTNYLAINMPIPDELVPEEFKGQLPGY